MRKTPPKHRGKLRVIADLCVVPLGAGTSLSGYVAECEKVLMAHGLKGQLHAYGTNVEGDWDNVFGALKACHERLHALGVPRITTTVKVGSRVDRAQTMDDKVRSVNKRLRKPR